MIRARPLLGSSSAFRLSITELKSKRGCQPRSLRARSLTYTLSMLGNDTMHPVQPRLGYSSNFHYLFRRVVPTNLEVASCRAMTERSYFRTTASGREPK